MLTKHWKFFAFFAVKITKIEFRSIASICVLRAWLSSALLQLCSFKWRTKEKKIIAGEDQNPRKLRNREQFGFCILWPVCSKRNFIECKIPSLSFQHSFRFLIIVIGTIEFYFYRGSKTWNNDYKYCCCSTVNKNVFDRECWLKFPVVVNLIRYTTRWH